MDYWRSIFRSIRDKLASLNLFENELDGPNAGQHELTATRLLLILFSIGMVILTVYTANSTQTKTKVVQYPTQEIFESLEKTYFDTIKCDCSQVSIPYRTFVETKVILHQVCESDFISQSWHEFAFNSNIANLLPMDVRKQLSAIWQLISTLCLTAKNIIMSALNDFAATHLISLFLLSEPILKQKTSATLNSVRETSKSMMLLPFTVLDSVGKANMYFTGLSTNYATILWRMNEFNRLSIATFGIRFYLEGLDEECECIFDETCPVPFGIYLYDVETFGYYEMSSLVPNFTLPGLVSDCTPLQSTFASTLECFYSQDCLDLIMMSYENTINVSILNPASKTRYLVNATIQTMAEELFVEEIINNTNYSSYYKECAPVQCSYTYQQRLDRNYIVATLIALIGGLYMGLRLIIPYMIHFLCFLKDKYSRRSFNEGDASRVALMTRLMNLLNRLKILAITLNTFNKRSQDPSEIRQERITTRVYILLMVISITALVIRTIISVQSDTEKIHTPVLEKYEALQHQYPNSIRCPCSLTSFIYHEFIEIKPVYHQLCDSHLIEPWWHNSLAIQIVDFAPSNFIYYASAYFRVLAMFCKVSKLALVDAITRFLLTTHVSTQIVPKDLFESETEKIVDTFLNLTRSQFQITFSLVNQILLANKYISGLLTNGVLDVMNISSELTGTIDISEIAWFNQIGLDENNQSCTCDQNSHCSIGLVRDDFTTVDGVSTRCFVLNSVLKSTLKCWYNQTCLDQLLSSTEFNTRALRNVSALDLSITSRFTIGDLVEEILGELMVEQYNLSWSYDRFYTLCKPAYCIITYSQRSSIVYIITTVISLFGGLNVGLKIICPFLTNIFTIQNIQSIFSHRRNTPISKYESFSDEIPMKLNVWTNEMLSSSYNILSC